MTIMSPANLTVSEAIGFVSQLGLSSNDTLTVSEAINKAPATAWATIGILLIYLCFPDRALKPGTEAYTKSQQINW